MRARGSVRIAVFRASAALGCAASGVTWADPPTVFITSPPATVAFETTSYAISGYASNATWPFMVISNAANGAQQGFAAPPGGVGLWTSPSVTLEVGTNGLAVTAWNSEGQDASDSVDIVRESQATNAGMGIEITTPPATVSFATTSYWIEGVAYEVCLPMTVSNSANGISFETWAPDGCSGDWWTVSMSLQVGTNTFVVTASNGLGDTTWDSVSIVRQGDTSGPMPWLDITTPAGTVPYATTSCVIEGVACNVTKPTCGVLCVSNSANGFLLELAPPDDGCGPWLTPALPLEVGTNTLAVWGSNWVVGLEQWVTAADGVDIVREGGGPTDPELPAVHMITAPTTVPYGTSHFAIVGYVNAFVTGTMWASNAASGAVYPFASPVPPTYSWTSPPVALVLGTNPVSVCGLNGTGAVACDSVEIARLAPPLGPVHYVSLTSSNPVHPYLSWATAATNIQDALDAARDGDTVIVGDGAYDSGGRAAGNGLTNRIAITNAVIVRSLNGPASTFIVGQGPRGDNAIRCAYVGMGALLTGFTLTNGYTRDSFRFPDDPADGGGVFCEDGAVVSNCVITGNSAMDGGGALLKDGASLWDCTIVGNVSSRPRSGGGGVYAYSSGIVARSLIRGNTATRGGGILGGRVINSVIDRNSTSGGSGGGAFGSEMDNCTIVGNSTPWTGGGCAGGILRNCILYSNSAAVSDPNWTASDISYTCTWPMPEGAGNITNEPRFMDYAADDYHLSSNSPCINAGTNMPWMSGGVDLDGNPRIFGEIVDLGCYEYTAYSLVIEGNPVAGDSPSPLGYGIHRIAAGTTATNCVSSPADEDGGTRHVSMGWTWTGSVPGTGSANCVTFKVTTNATLAWNWRTEHYLALLAANGTIAGAAAGWKPDGFVYDLIPSNAFGYVFDRWVVNGTNVGSAIPLAVVMDGPKTIEAVFATTFVDVTGESSANIVQWDFSRQSGTYFGTLELCNRTNSQKRLLSPYWYVAESNAFRRLMHPDGIETNSGLPYVNITSQVVAGLPGVGNGDLVLDPGECVLVSGIEFYSYDRTIPTGFVVAVWADPPSPNGPDMAVGDTDGDGMPNAWEDAHPDLCRNDPFDGGEDPDRDGFNNLAEYYADTDPRDSVSKLQMLGVLGGRGSIRVGWVGGAQADQYLERSDNLSSWFSVFTNPAPTEITNWLEVGQPGEAIFFRVRVPRRP